MSEKDVEALLKCDTVARKFVVRRKASRVRRLGSSASGVGLLEGINAFTVLVQVVHQVHFCETRAGVRFWVFLFEGTLTLAIFSDHVRARLPPP